MTLEDFKDVYKDKSPVEKLKLMAVQFDYWRQDAVDKADASWRGCDDDIRYYRGECAAMAARVKWLMEEIEAALTPQEPRMMFAAEVAACPVGMVLWVEERQGVVWNLFPLEIDVSSTHPDSGTDYLFFITYHDVRKFECSEYNQTWRCWTGRPTREQRMATPWV